MGLVLLRYYQYIYAVKHVRGRVALAEMTNMPSSLAAEEPDSPENIRLFREAVAKITGAEPPTFSANETPP